MKVIFEKENSIMGMLTPDRRYLSELQGTELQKLEQIANKDLPVGTNFTIVENDEVPEDRLIKEAWDYIGGSCVLNMENLKIKAHDKRRKARDVELKPLDNEWTYQPDIAEEKRILVREKYAIMQTDIDDAGSISALKEVIKDII